MQRRLYHSTLHHHQVLLPQAPLRATTALLVPLASVLPLLTLLLLLLRPLRYLEA